jgi:hypothetical protein
MKNKSLNVHKRDKFLSELLQKESIKISTFSVPQAADRKLSELGK